MTSSNKKLLNFANKLPTTFASRPVLPGNFVERLSSKDELDDFEFDQILPARYRFSSDVHWTSIQVARLIADQLGPESTQKFVDVGSGVGKLCILLSLLTKMEIYGIEQRQHLHEVAETIVKTNAIERVNLRHGNMMDMDWEQFDVFFLFNPFMEQRLKIDILAIDQQIDRNEETYAKYVEFVERKISALPVGKRLITLEGFGGRVPESWSLVSSAKIVDGEFEHWIKSRE